ncbi:MAG TPA: aminotransferase class V-fold PLP-dependent enzyme [Jatrophihabitans sp.]|nr:aminotransferase class V-fold PLP-dependent enzyme [Jatrophihabitans sp.]
MTGGYLDAAAGLPWHPVAVEALQAALADGWADPGRLARPGRRSAVLLDAARAAIAAEFGVHPDELIVTPSGAHALHQAVLGSLAGRHRAGRTLVHSAVEHSAVLKAAQWHAGRGGSIDVVPVEGTGRVDPNEFLAAAGAPGVATAVLQAANHEVGTRQPVAEVAAGLAESAVPLVVDAGHQLVYGEPPAAAPIFTADARLWGGPAGVGLLVVRRGSRWLPPFPVDESESGRGLGVPNVPVLVAAAAALRATRADRTAQAARLAGLLDQLRHRIPLLVPDAVLFGPDRPADRLPHLLTFSCPYVDGEALLTELDRLGFAVSSGSSCTSDSLVPSHVLVAMGALSSGNIRLSLHPGVEQADIDRFLEVLPAAVAEVRSANPRPVPPRAPSAPADNAGPVLDSRGRRCPLPILDLARALPDLPVGGELTVLADDPAAASDIPAWCRMTGQQLVDTDGTGRYRVRRVR